MGCDGRRHLPVCRKVSLAVALFFLVPQLGLYAWAVVRLRRWPRASVSRSAVGPLAHSRDRAVWRSRCEGRAHRAVDARLQPQTELDAERSVELHPWRAATTAVSRPI